MWLPISHINFLSLFPLFSLHFLFLPFLLLQFFFATSTSLSSFFFLFLSLSRFFLFSRLTLAFTLSFLREMVCAGVCVPFILFCLLSFSFCFYKAMGHDSRKRIMVGHAPIFFFFFVFCFCFFIKYRHDIHLSNLVRDGSKFAVRMNTYNQ